MNTGKYVGRLIYVYDQDGNNLASTTVLKCRSDMIITVKGIIRNSSEFVAVLIIEPDGVHEYQGRIARENTAYMTTDLALFKGKVKELRSSKRYTVKVMARVDFLLFGEKHTPLPHPVEALVVNLSTSGVLLQAKPNSFNANSVVELELPIGDDVAKLRTKIMRIKHIDGVTEEYGCEFI